MKYIILLFSLFYCLTTQGQSEYPQYHVLNTAWGFSFKYHIDGENVSRQQFQNSIMKYHPPAIVERFKSARGRATTGLVIGNISSLFLGYQFGLFITRRDPNVIVFVGSLVGTVLGAVINNSGVKRMNSVFKPDSSGLSLSLFGSDDQLRYGVKYRF